MPIFFFSRSPGRRVVRIFEASENERRAAAIRPLLVPQDENKRLAAEWRLFLKAHFVMLSEGSQKISFIRKVHPSHANPLVLKRSKNEHHSAAICPLLFFLSPGRRVARIFEAFENERLAAAWCPFWICRNENECLAAEWRTFLKAHFAMHSEGHQKIHSIRNVHPSHAKPLVLKRSKNELLTPT